MGLDGRKIVRDLGRLPHDERMKRMVALGREARRKPDVAAVIAALARGDFFERMLALQSVHGSQDGCLAARAAVDPSRRIRGRSLWLVALYADDAVVAGVLRDARPSLRLPLLRRLRARGRLGPVDGFLDALAAGEDRDLVALLPFGSPSAVGRHAARALERGTPATWTRLARFHPDDAVDLLEARIAAADADGARMRAEANAVLDVLARTRPGDAAQLAARLSRRWPLGTLALARLARARPNDVAALVAGSDDEIGPFGPRPRPDGLDERNRLALLASRPELLPQPERWLGRLRPARREPAFDAAGLAWRDATGAVSVQILAHLPRDRRVSEARRHLSLPALAAAPGLRLPYAALLPWEEARSACAPYLGHPQPLLRSAAAAALLGSVRYERSRLADALALMEARKNEQDPVRLAMLSALAALPTAAFGPQTLEATGRVLRHALDAADLSSATTAAAQRLVVRLLPRHPSWAAAWLETLVRERGSIALDDLESRWSDAHTIPLGAVLAPLLKVWSRRERDGQITVLANALGARLRTFPTLHPHLERIARESREWASAWALRLLARHARDRFAALVPRLLRDDRSWGTQAEVYSHLHRRRQDLLTPFLGRRAWRGRFSTGRTRFVLPLVGGFQRWTPAQQRTFAMTLAEVTAPRDRSRDTPTVLLAVRQLAALPAVAPDRLLALARDASRPAVRAGVLRALAHLDTDAGVATLVASLSDERARTAAYSLRRALLDMQRANAVRLLRAAPLKVLTVAKEVLRVLGEIPGDDAFALLRTLSDESSITAPDVRRPVHRDLRVALLHAYWGHLDRPEAWEEIDRAAGETDAALVSGVVRMPSEGLSNRERERFAAVLERLLSHPDPTIRCDVLARLVSDPIDDREGRLVAATLGRLRSPLPAERAAAGQAVAHVANAANAARVAAALGSLADDRRGQKALVEALVAATPLDRVRLVPAARAAIDALAPDEPTAALRAALTVAALPGPERTEALEALARADSITADVLHVVIEALATLAARPTAAEIDDLSARLGASKDERLRRIALAGLVARSDARRGPGWTAERLERLRAFREDRSPLVAAAAQFTLPLAELEGSGSVGGIG